MISFLFDEKMKLMFWRLQAVVQDLIWLKFNCKDTHLQGNLQIHSSIRTPGIHLTEAG
jgi:hypothetical protein